MPPRLAPGVYNDIAPPALSYFLTLRVVALCAMMTRGRVIRPVAFHGGNEKVMMQNVKFLWDSDFFINFVALI